MKRFLILIMLGLMFLTSCSSNEVTDTLKLIEESETAYVNTGKFIDLHKEAVFNYMKNKDVSLISDFATNKAIEKLGVFEDSNFVIVKQEYMTAIGHANITHYLLLRQDSKLKIVYLFWTEQSLYDVEMGDVLYA